MTGVTGAVGGRVARSLVGAGWRVRMLVRERSRAPDLDAEVAEASDYGNAEAFQEALEGVATLFLVSGREHPERLQQHLTAVDCAVTAGVGRIVYLSFLGAAPNATFTLARQHFATEEHIRATGIPFTFLRSSLYVDFMPFLASADGVIAGPAGTGRFAPVARADVADTVFSVLTTPGHDGNTYENTGPATLSMEEVAQELSRVTGRQIRYEDQTIEQAWESRRPSGAPDWEIEGWISSYLAIANGEMRVVTDAVPVLSGHQAMTLPEFLDRYPESYAHLI
ncbi:MAG TPA: SDR family oxidoreductase [Actinomycetota bacterium]|nr:SDR family oxidoreductase [Actinomycetota bacterium]